eukprot:1388045-Prymnesium_polylepis.1
MRCAALRPRPARGKDVLADSAKQDSVSPARSPTTPLQRKVWRIANASMSIPTSKHPAPSIRRDPPPAEHVPVCWCVGQMLSTLARRSPLFLAQRARLLSSQPDAISRT